MYQNAYFDGRTIHLWDDKLGYKKFSNKRYAYLPNKNGKFVALDGTRVKKVFRYDKDDENLFLKNKIINIEQSSVVPGSGINFNDYPKPYDIFLFLK